jgi:hypothetical protein
MSPDQLVGSIVAKLRLEDDGEIRLDPKALADLASRVRDAEDREAVAARLIAVAKKMKETPGTAFAVEELTTLAGLALGARIEGEVS